MRADRPIGDKLVISSVADASPIAYPLAEIPQNYRYDDTSDQPEASMNQPLSVPLSFHGGLAYSDYDGRTAFVNDGMILHEPNIIRPPILPTTVTLTTPLSTAQHPPMYFFEAMAPNATISLDAYSTGKGSLSATGGTLTWSHTVASQNDRILIVAISADTAAAASIPLLVLTVTYAGQTMTRLAYKEGATNVDAGVVLFYLLSPPTGANNIVVTNNDVAALAVVGGGTSLYDVNQDTPFGTVVTGTGTDGTPTITVTTSAGEFVLAVVALDTNDAFTAGANETERWDDAQSTDVTGAGFTQAGSDGGVMAPSIDGAATDWVEIAIPIKPAAAPVLYAIAVETDAVNVYKISLQNSNFGTLLNTKTFSVTTTQPMGRPAEFNDGSNTYWRLGLGDPSNRLQALTSIASGTSNDTWTASSDADARHLRVVGNELYRTTAENEVSVCSRGSNPATEANWGDEFYVGDKSTNITDIAEAGGLSYLTKEDGFYEWSGTGDPENVFPEIGRAERNGQGMLYWHGGFLIPAASALWWTRTGKPVGPDDNPHNRANDPSLGSTGYSKHGRWMGLAEFGEYIYGLYVSSAGTDAYLYYGRERDESDPPGWGPIIWHVLDRPTADFNDFHGCFITETSRFSDTETRPCLWYAHGNDVRYIWLDKDGAPMSRRGDIDLDTSGVVTSGQVGYGIGQVNKQFNVIQGWAEDFGSVSGNFRFSVAIDGGSFANVGSAISSDGFFQAFWTQDSSDTGRKMLARCTWTGTSSLTDTNGPHLRDVVMRAVALPRTTRVWTFLLMAEDKGKTAKKVRSELEGYKNDLKKFKLPDSDTLNGVLTSLRLLRADEIRDLTERNQKPPKFILEAKVREMLVA